MIFTAIPDGLLTLPNSPSVLCPPGLTTGRVPFSICPTPGLLTPDGASRAPVGVSDGVDTCSGDSKGGYGFAAVLKFIGKPKTDRMLQCSHTSFSSPPSFCGICPTCRGRASRRQRVFQSRGRIKWLDRQLTCSNLSVGGREDIEREIASLKAGPEWVVTDRGTLLSCPHVGLTMILDGVYLDWLRDMPRAKAMAWLKLCVSELRHLFNEAGITAEFRLSLYDRWTCFYPHIHCEVALIGAASNGYDWSSLWQYGGVDLLDKDTESAIQNLSLYMDKGPTKCMDDIFHDGKRVTVISEGSAWSFTKEQFYDVLMHTRQDHALHRVGTGLYDVRRIPAKDRKEVFAELEKVVSFAECRRVLAIIGRQGHAPRPVGVSEARETKEEHG